MSENHTDHEHEPLLRHHTEPITSAQQQYDDNEDNRTTTQRLAIAVPCFVLLLCLECGASMISVPLNEIIEQSICKDIHAGVKEPAADPRCKDTVVQSKLALILGWYLTFSLTPGLLTGIAWGIAADRYGRKAVLVLANIGIVLGIAATVIVCRYPQVFSIRMIWGGCIFYFIGGGSATYNALIFTMTSDISTQAQRSTAFFYLGSAATAGTLIAGPSTYLIMELGGPWFSMYCGLALFVLTVPITIALPETRSEAVVRRTALASMSTNDGTARALQWDIRPLFCAAREYLSAIFRILFIENPTVGIFLFSTLFTVLGQSVVMVLLQYAAKRFRWSWSKAGLLLTVKGVSSLVLTAVLLPMLSQLLLSKAGMTPLIKDWWIVRGSAVISVLAFLAMGLAPTASLFIASMVFGELVGGMYLGLRSMLTELIDPTHIALLMTVSSVFLTISELIAGPLLAQLFRVGMELGGRWVGLPFFASAAMLAMTATMVISVPIRGNARARSSAPTESDS